MKKRTILSVILGLIYYILGIVGFFYLFIFAALFGIIGDFSEALFLICFLVLPITVLIMPIILKFVLKKEFYKSILWSLVSVLIYFAIIFIVNVSVSEYIGKFTIEKWSNEQCSNLRYLMLNSLEEQYDFIGMSKQEVIDILGNEYEHENRIYYFVGSEWLRSYYYCLEYDENDIITKFYVEIEDM